MFTELGKTADGRRIVRVSIDGKIGKYVLGADNTLVAYDNSEETINVDKLNDGDLHYQEVSKKILKLDKKNIMAVHKYNVINGFGGNARETRDQTAVIFWQRHNARTTKDGNKGEPYWSPATVLSVNAVNRLLDLLDEAGVTETAK